MVSRIGAGKVRPQRANLAAHHRVLRDLAEQRPVLPVVFGTVAGGEEELRGLLRRNHDALAGLLERLRGKVEMGLKVYWDLPNVFEYFVATHQELEAMRDRLFRPGRTPTRRGEGRAGRAVRVLAPAGPPAPHAARQRGPGPLLRRSAQPSTRAKSG